MHHHYQALASYGVRKSISSRTGYSSTEVASVSSWAASTFFTQQQLQSGSFAEMAAGISNVSELRSWGMDVGSVRFEHFNAYVHVVSSTWARFPWSGPYSILPESSPSGIRKTLICMRSIIKAKTPCKYKIDGDSGDSDFSTTGHQWASIHSSFSTYAPGAGNPVQGGVAHGDDLFYLFPGDGDQANLNRADKKVSDELVVFWTSFAATGVPYEQWPTFQGNSRSKAWRVSHTRRMNSEDIFKLISFFTGKTGPYLIINEPLRVGKNFTVEYGTIK